MNRFNVRFSTRTTEMVNRDATSSIRTVRQDWTIGPAVALLLVAIVFPRVAFAEPNSDRPKLLLLRAEEEWSALEDPAMHKSPFDRIKYLGLGAPNYYLSLGGESRVLYRLFVNEGFGAVDQDFGSLLLRLSLHSSFQLGKYFRLFAEYKSATETGKSGGPKPLDVNTLDLHQGFAEISLDNSIFRIGRQEFSFGAERMFSVREGQNVRRSFDGLNARINLPHLRVDVLGALEVPLNAGVFDDNGGARPKVWGAHGDADLSENMGAAAYYFGLSRRTMGGSELRHSVGLRWGWDSARFQHDVEGTYQLGTFKGEPADQKIRAWQIAGSAALKLSSKIVPSQINLQGGIASGDTDVGDSSIGTFRALFPTRRRMGMTTGVGMSNLGRVEPGFKLNLQQVSVSGNGRFMWRLQSSDTLFSPSGRPIGVRGEDGHFVGGGGELRIGLRLNEYVRVHGIGELFVPTAVLGSPRKVTSFLQMGAHVRF